MAVNLKNLSPKELQAVIAEAQSKMKEARVNLIQDVRKKIDALLAISGLTLVEIYPTRGSKKTVGIKGTVASKYRDPADPSRTWSGRGRQPLWFVAALKRRGITTESLLITRAPKAAKVAKASVKKAKRSKS